MTIITITRRAKCKDCAFFVRTYEGRRVVHKCSRNGPLGELTNMPSGAPVTLKSKSCAQFKLF